MDYKTGNPALSDKTFQGLTRPSDAAGPMTLQGTVNRALMLLAMLLATALWSWGQFFSHAGDPSVLTLPMMGGLVGGFVLALIISFKQTTAPYLALPYAALEGLAIGGISAIMEKRYPGIAIQAAELTFGVLATLLVAYSLRLIHVTERFKSIVVAATGAIALVYLVSFVLSFFHINMPLLNDASPMGLLISGVIIVVAALNLVLDFSFIESGVAQGAPRYMEWYSAFGLMVTLVWLYLEILRFLGKARQR